MNRHVPLLAAFCAVFAALGACTTEADDLFGQSGSGSPLSSSGNSGGAGGNTGGASASSSSSGNMGGAGGSSSSSGNMGGAGGTGGAGGIGGAGGMQTNPVCGNNVCEMGEDPATCLMDCPPVCGDGQCNGGETNGTCSMDCPPCPHEVCIAGDKLPLGCGDPCVDMVCAQDIYCCDTAWDGQCVGAVKNICGTDCCGDGNCSGEDCNGCPQDCGACPPPPECAHSACVAGAFLDPTKCFDPCVSEICMADMQCCTGSPPAWNGDCTILAHATCGADPCVTAVCAQDPTCCTTDWTAACVALAVTECMTGCDCPHPICMEGEKLDPGCDPCAAELCGADPYCCDNAWDGLCVGEVGSICNINCN